MRKAVLAKSEKMERQVLKAILQVNLVELHNRHIEGLIIGPTQKCHRRELRRLRFRVFRERRLLTRYLYDYVVATDNVIVFNHL